MRSSRIFSHLSKFVYIVMVLVWITLILSYLSRAGVLELAGAAVVATGSMRPHIEPGDLVIYVSTAYEVGDVVFYCKTPSFCVVHRLVGVMEMSGNGRLLFTRGDANGADDPPVFEEMVKGKVIAVVPREIWIPPMLAALAYAMIDLSRSRMGLAYTIWTLPALLFVFLIYAMLAEPPAVEKVDYPIFSLVGVYYEGCNAVIKYRGELNVSRATALVDGQEVPVKVDAKSVSLRIPAESLMRAFHEAYRPRITINASLNEIGTLRGSYELLVWGSDPEISLSGDRLIISNPNCFPIEVTVIEDGRARRLSVDGGSSLELDISGRSVGVEWLSGGERRWRAWIR